MLTIMRNNSGSFFLVKLAGFILWLRIFQYSWVTDDAFITFRSVLNFVNGNGPVFNIGERVQSFTHPLWFFMLSIGGMLDLNLYFFSIVLGLTFSLFAIIVLANIGKNSAGGDARNFGLAFSFLFLAASESFVSFATSGLENSLTYCLVALAVALSLAPNRRTLFYLVTALALLNRLDVVFIIAPLLGWVAYSDYRAGRFRAISLVIGFFPLAAWHVFSLIYYGFLFPNTKYAKVGGRPFFDNAESGVLYLIDSAQAEWHVWLAIFLLPLIFYIVALRNVNNNSRQVAGALLVGMLFHIAYVVFVSGGDFMRGRFFTTTTLAAAMLLILLLPSFSTKRFFYIWLVPFLVLSGWVGAKEKILMPAAGVANERNFYKSALALNLDPSKNYTQHPWAVQARNLDVTSGVIVGMNGQRAYWVPREIDLIDLAGLADPFIARLPITSNSRTGHFERDIPVEYLNARSALGNGKDWENFKYEELYEKITLVTRSPEYFSMERYNAMIWVWRNYGI